MTRPVALLLLGGTQEARALAHDLTGVSSLRVVTSRAGRVRLPGPTDGEVRTGGFGGVDGLASWIRAHSPALVVDATHPFAEQISRHAVAAALRAEGTPLLRLQRPGWTAGPGDDWHRVGDLGAAAALTPTLGSRPFVTTGRQRLSAFIRHPACVGLDILVRCVDEPEDSLPSRVRVLRARGPYTREGERTLFREHGVDVLVTKDSGGESTAAKLHAARDFGVPVVLVDRPPPPPVPTVSTVDEAAAWVRAQAREAQRSTDA
ncbi:MAG: cobalt-precorrin-6A reductase [Actinomycetes bacterium]